MKYVCDVCGWEYDEELGYVNVVHTRLCFYDFYTLVLTQLSDYCSDICSNLSINRLSPIFWCEDYVILTVPFCMRQAICFFSFL